MLDVATIFDALEMRCPRLGGEVNFLYCRKVAEGWPCSRSLVCWEPAFPVYEYMVRILTEEEWREVFEKPPQGRLEKILSVAAGVKDKTGLE